MKVFIGYDPREHEAAVVAANSLHRVTRGEIEPEFLRADKLRAHGLLWRTADHRGGQRYDLTGNETYNTEFKFSRFLTPMLADGMALFVDTDVVFLRDPRMMFDPADNFAVYVVKHAQTVEPNSFKMVNQRQVAHPRKNWSSVVLWDCNHPANRRLSLRDVNERPGADLHSFYWLADSEIGELSPQWNWLVDVEPRPVHPGIAHMTLGGPWLPGWASGSFDAEWRAARDAQG